MPCLLVSGKRDSDGCETLRMEEHQEQEKDGGHSHFEDEKATE